MRSLFLAYFVVLFGGGRTATTETEFVSYDGYKVFRVKTHGHTSSVQERLSTIAFEQWTQAVDHVDIAVSANQLVAFEALKLDFHVMHENLGNSIAAESAITSTWKRQADDLSWYDSYHNYEDHIQYFQDLQASFPNNSELISSGTSYENRSIFGLHLWGTDGPGKPAVLYHGGVVEYLILQLLTGYNDTRFFLKKYDFYVFPTVNPDGFVYTQTTDRLWRKNRQPPPPPPANQSCYGRDVNRNWEFAWDVNPNGASTNACAEAYRGEAPSDAPENAALDRFVRELRDGAGIKLFIDWHSYGQLYAPELGKWTAVASLMSETIRDSSEARTTFTFGPSGATLYATTGAAPDHVYSVGKANFSYTIELPDTGDYGFVLPPEKIRPTVEEQWAGQKVLLGVLEANFFG
ncbi:hypothetical protein BJ170DRAFT_708255 [Xylariales sp. AK1849]|nr:hypothetical protein BJ170DRAFT_708255 [Xylariales sp. AK1849]